MNGFEEEAHNRRQRMQWSMGDYTAIAAQYERAAEDLAARAGIEPGMRVLDIATGTGNAAIAAARCGATVTGLDLTPELFDDAERRATALGLHIDWDEGAADALPYDDASFDRVLSAFGLMFVHDSVKAARELVRVLQPDDGRFALCNWMPAGPVQQVIETLGGPAGPSRTALMSWGDPERVRVFFSGLDISLEFHNGSVAWMFPTAEDGVRWLEEVVGPVIAAKAALQASGVWDITRERLVEWIGQHVRDDLDGVWITADYLIAIGQRT